MPPVIEIIMAFDFGVKNIGIAIGQNLTHTTQPLKVLKSKSGIPNWKNIEYIYNEWKPTRLIVGLPLKIDGSAQFVTTLSKQFAIQLKKRFHITVEMYDERFSTVEARSHYLEYYHDNLITKIRKTNLIDSIAAEIILKSWFNQSSDDT